MPYVVVGTQCRSVIQPHLPQPGETVLGASF